MVVIEVEVDVVCLNVGVNFIDCMGGFCGSCLLIVDLEKFDDLLCCCFIIVNMFFKLCVWLVIYGIYVF